MSDSWRFWTTSLIDDLRPTPGRMARALRLVLVTVITLIVVMTFRLPAAALGLYFAFLVNRTSPQLTVRSSLVILVSVIASVALQLLVITASENAPIVRFLSLSTVVFLAGILIHESGLPVLGNVLGIIYARLIPSWDVKGPANPVVESSLSLILTLSVALGSSIFVEYLFAYRDPADLLQEERVRRYAALEEMFSSFARGAGKEELTPSVRKVTQLADAGQVEMQALYASMADRRLDCGQLPAGVQVRNAMLARLMDLSAAFGTEYLEKPTPELRERCGHLASICQRMREGRDVPEAELPASDAMHRSHLERVEAGLAEILRMPAMVGCSDRLDLVYVPPQPVMVLEARAFRNVEALGFALRLSACATLCYVFYNATGWPGLSNSVLTVLVAAAVGSAAVTQRLAFRLVGTVVGGLLLGIGSVALLYPDMDEITSLTLLVALVCFVFAWCGAGRQFGFFGAQLAFSFYTVAITGPGPQVDLVPARDSFLAVLYATILMWVVFDWLWPVTTSQLMRRMLASALRDTAALLTLLDGSEDRSARAIRARTLRYKLGKTVEQVRAASELVPYESRARRGIEAEAAGRIVQVALTTASFFWGRMALLYGDQEPTVPPDVVQVRREISRELDAMADALEDSHLDSTKTRALGHVELPAHGAENDQEWRSAQAGFLRIREGVLALLP